MLLNTVDPRFAAGARSLAFGLSMSLGTLLAGFGMLFASAEEKATEINDFLGRFLSSLPTKSEDIAVLRSRLETACYLAGVAAGDPKPFVLAFSALQGNDVRKASTALELIETGVADRDLRAQLVRQLELLTQAARSRSGNKSGGQ